jgi:anti-anti-sigma regulatory factor
LPGRSLPVWTSQVPSDITLERDRDAGLVLVHHSGELSPTLLSAAVGKAAAECPAAVVVDLSGLGPVDESVVGVFPVLTKQVQHTWGVPVLLCCATEEIVRALGSLRGEVALYDCRDDAMLAVRAGVPRWACEHLPAVPASVGAARRLVSRSCTAWELEQLSERACLVVSELATNAIQHTGEAFDVVISGTSVFLRVGVQDTSVSPPRILNRPGTSGAIVRSGSGRGLRIVAGSATHWGCTALPGGKIVWALLRA